MRNGRWIPFAAVAALAAATPARAQTPVSVQVTPKIGGMLFTSKLPARFAMVGQGDNPVELANAELKSSLSYGGDLTIRIGRHLGIQGIVAYAPASLESKAGGFDKFDVNVLNYGADLAYYLPVNHRFEPFVAGGFGYKRYDYKYPGVAKETDYAWNFGAGLDARLFSIVALRLEARDFTSLFDSALENVSSVAQHDLALSAGLTVTLGHPPGIEALRR